MMGFINIELQVLQPFLGCRQSRNPPNLARAAEVANSEVESDQRSQSPGIRAAKDSKEREAITALVPFNAEFWSNFAFDIERISPIPSSWFGGRRASAIPASPSRRSLSRTEDAHASEAPRRRPRTDQTAISSAQSPDPIVECRLCGSYVTGFCHRMSSIFSIYRYIDLTGHVLSSFLSDLGPRPPCMHRDAKEKIPRPGRPRVKRHKVLDLGRCRGFVAL